jgi:hypothetical protein
MRTVHELTQDELEELRCNYFNYLLDNDPDKLDTVFLPNQMRMDYVIKKHEGIMFTDEDFFCNL